MLSPAQNKNTKKIKYAISSGLVLFIFFGISFPEVVHAVGVLDFLGDTFADAIKGILYAIFVAVGSFVSIAVGLFEYAIDPLVYGPNGLFNKVSVYNMWKFIRDFFNLFFILTLLYTAFTIVFQIAGNYKKTLLSIVLAALFVNFSFPLSRVMIDATNVPMYYFANLIMSSTGGSATSASATLGPALSASGLKDILIPQETEIRGMTVSQILLGIIFLFVFMVTLMVLAVLFVVRMMALLVLVMFSSVGFAGSVIPGMKQYSDMWWDKFRQYALFGPAAMFMLYIATQLFSEISKDKTKQALNIATAANATSQSTSFLASAGMYSITIIMLWIAIGLANSMSIIGASAIAGRGQQFLKWAGKKSAGGITYAPRKFASGVGQGVKSRFNDSKFGKFLAAPSRLEAYGKGVGKTVGREDIIDVGKAAQKEYKTEKEKFHTRRVAEEEKRMEEERSSDSQLRAIVNSPNTNDKETVEAAVRLLSKRGGFQDTAQLTQALTAIDVANAGNPTIQAEKRAEVIKKADKELFRDATSLVGALSHLTGDTKSMIQLIDKVDAKGFDGMTTAQYNSLAKDPIVKDKLDQKLKKEGHAKVLIDADITGSPAGPGGVPPARPPMARQAAYDKHLGGMTAEDLGKVRGVHGGAGRPADAELIAYVTDQVATGNWSPKEHADAYSKLGAEQKAAWRAAGIHP